MSRASLIGAIALAGVLAPAPAPSAGDPPLDVAACGRVSVVSDASGRGEDGGPPWTLRPGAALVIGWDVPRDVREVILRFRGTIPAPSAIAVSWWRRVWPDNGSGGWMELDDPFNGDWNPTRTECTPDGSELRIRVLPLDRTEAPGVRRTGDGFRRTYRIRITTASQVDVDGVEVHTGAVRGRASLRFEWQGPRPLFEARNGRILSVVEEGACASVVHVEYGRSEDPLSADRGLVVFRGGPGRSFSVFVDDVLREGGLVVRGLDVFVGDKERGISRSTWKGPTGDVWTEGTVREQVARLPEQSFEAVMEKIPRKPPQHVFLGVPDLRQEIAVTPEGHVQLLADSLRAPGSDLERGPWTWDDLILRIETPSGAKRATRRSLAEGWLPVVRHEWKDGVVEYVETCVASTLSGDIASLRSDGGTEPVVLLARVSMRNAAADPRTAELTLEWNHPLPLRLDGGLLILEAPSDGKARAALTPVRARFDGLGRGTLEPATTSPGPGVVAMRYRVELAPGEAHAVEISVPYIELLDAEEIAALRGKAFEETTASVVSYWKERAARGMTYEVPDLFLPDLFRANLWHVLISTDIDPTTRFREHGAATHRYKNYLNETAMVAESLEMRGEHDEARKLLEPFLECQGVLGLPGNFRSREGVLYAAHPGQPDPYTAQGYNMHHGWGLLQAARHYFFTRDASWFRGVADRLVAGCDWVVRERRATQVLGPGGARPVEYGLAPAGDLEDVEEYLYFYATNAYYFAGMDWTARALGAVGHPAAARVAGEAEAYLKDIRTSVEESVATSAVVRLRDGSYVPWVPPRTHAVTHLREGWIREALYSALHLVHCGVYPEAHPFTEWMADDLEDNIFLGKESGYGIERPRERFFDLGGFTLQPNLVDLCLTYLRRDESPAFLRAFYNTAWASLYPDVLCFAEWVPQLGKGGGPLYKTPDECKFIQWMRYQLILEREGGLELGLGVPRAWMAQGKRVRVSRAATLFGELDLEIESEAGRGEIVARARLRPREKPAFVRIRLRHPSGKPLRSAEANGAPARVDGRRQVVELPQGVFDWEVRGSF